MKFLNSLNYEKQVFFKLLVLVTIPVFVMGILSCHIYIRSESAKRQLTLENYNSQLSGEFDNIFSSVKEYYIDVANGEDFTWMLHQDAVPYSYYSNLKEARKTLCGNYFMTRYIDDFEFLNLGSGWVFDNYGLFPFGEIQNREIVDAFLDEQEKVQQNVYWLNRVDVPEPVTGNIRNSNSVNTQGLSLVLKRELSGGGMVWLLLVRIREDTLQEFCQSYVDMGYDVAVLKDKEVLLETCEDFTKAYLSMEDGTDVCRGESGIKYKISQNSRGGVNGFTYIVGYDAAMVSRNASIFVWVSFGVVAVFALLLIIIHLAAMAFSQPLLKLQQYADDQNKQIRELLVRHLIKGELDQDKIRLSLQKSDIVPCSAYRMISFTGKEEAGKDRGRYNHIIENLPKAILDKIFIAPVCFEDNMVFLAGDMDDDAVDNSTSLLYREIKDYLEGNQGLITSSGISRRFHQLHHVRRAYKECNEALHNKLNCQNQEGSTLVLFDDYKNLDKSTNVYDKIVEDECIGAVAGCREEEAVQLLGLIIKRMDMKGVVGMERDLYLIRLTSAMLNIPTGEGISLSRVFDSSQYNILNRITQIYGVNELLEFFRSQIIVPIIQSLMKEKEEAAGPDIIQQLMAILKESNGKLTLNECAQQMNYHPNYLSKVLKRERGVTFTEIVNDEKLKQAKYMLLTTEYSIAEISERLEYNNVQNFIRFFKNHVGFTPAAFRKEHSK